ncbi:unnamed protein product [Ectocarpus sp. CCAP 1310/34]|nr:unnamed protein product [Ectocarpus sp. CCAP 1310/34]
MSMRSVLVPHLQRLGGNVAGSDGGSGCDGCGGGEGAAKVHSPAAAATVARPAAAVEMTASTVSRGARRTLLTRKDFLRRRCVRRETTTAVARSTGAAVAAAAKRRRRRWRSLGGERQSIPLTERSGPGGGEQPGRPCWEWTSRSIEVEMHGHMPGGDASHQASAPPAAAAAGVEAPAPRAAATTAFAGAVEHTSGGSVFPRLSVLPPALAPAPPSSVPPLAPHLQRQRDRYQVTPALTRAHARQAVAGGAARGLPGTLALFSMEEDIVASLDAHPLQEEPPLPNGPAHDLETPATSARAYAGPHSAIWGAAEKRGMDGLVRTGMFEPAGGL